jgi:phosphoribosyl 1,2-cyclic phosphate phosphodiesterase
MSALRVTILGCGSSGGVPRIGGPDGGGDWGVCDQQEPKNRRSRCSLLVQRLADDKPDDAGGATSVLVDTSPDLRAQLLTAHCARLDAVLYTHDHADQTHGIDDLRSLALAQRQRIPVYIDDATAGALTARFAYCFVQAEGSYYPPILERRVMAPCGHAMEIAGPGGPIPATAFRQRHGNVDALGFRFGDLAYSPDVNGVPDESFEVLKGVRTWIVDALQIKPHATHAHLDMTLGWIARLKPERAILTNLHIHMDYATLKRDLPPGVEPAYDGMVVDARA